MFPVIFLHIPKTAGTTLKSILTSRYPKLCTISIGNDINGDIRKFRSLDIEVRNRIRLLQGHMAFGLHDWLAPGTRYVTVLRSPVERVLSEFRFLKSNHRHPFHEAVSSMSLGDYLASEFNDQSRNGQTRLLAGNGDARDVGVPTSGTVDELRFNQAIDNIDRHFAVVGTQERFEESLLLMRRELGWWGYPLYVPRNITSAPDYRLSENEQELLQKLNQWDMRLYDYVSGRLDREIVAAQPDLQKSLGRMRWLNPWYRRLYMRFRTNR